VEHPNDLDGLRILVVEDSFLLAEEVCIILRGSGGEVVGPVGRLKSALEFACKPALNGAILDVNLAGEYCIPVAELLLKRAIPFLFLTGYDGGEAMIPTALSSVPRLSKPVNRQELLAAAVQLFRPPD
jgi:DNA-binding response OmpR family regulator